jgi:sporulation integral membrane protein YlbJ
MRQNKLLSKTEAERLLAFTNNSGPLFIVGAVAVGMFKMPGIGIFLLSCHVLASLTVGILFRFYRRKSFTMRNISERNLLLLIKKELEAQNSLSFSNIGGVFGEAIKNSVLLLLNIGGFIIFFSVIINLLIDVGFINYLSGIIYIFVSPIGMQKDIISSLLSGFFEITTGTNIVSQASGASLISKLTAASMVIGWAGLSVHSQVLSIINKTDISIKPYLFGKFLQGVFASIYTFIGMNSLGWHFQNEKTAFSPFLNTTADKWYNCFFSSCEILLFNLFIFVFVLVISLLIMIPTKRKSHR